MTTRPRPIALFSTFAAGLLVGAGALALLGAAPTQDGAGGKPAPANAKPAAAAAASADLDSRVVGRSTAHAEKGTFGEFHQYVEGSTRSLKDLVVGECILEPGKAIHPAHTHAEEEFLYVAKGEGTWNFDGKEVVAHEGDLLFVEPWKLHGITNTGKDKLTFFVVKWNGRQLPVPEKPAEK